MSPISRPTSVDDELFVGGREAARRAGRSFPFICRAAILGKIRVKLEPGIPPQFNVADINALPPQRVRQ